MESAVRKRTKDPVTRENRGEYRSCIRRICLLLCYCPEDARVGVAFAICFSGCEGTRNSKVTPHSASCISETYLPSPTVSNRSWFESEDLLCWALLTSTMNPL